jgi:ribosomal protein S18 acetylase RimI-like enzyme
VRILGTNGNYQIEGAGLADFNALRALEQVCFGGDAWPWLDLVGVLVMPGLVRVKACARGRMVGFVGGDPHPAEGIGWIATLGVLPEFRRMGIATALLHECEQRMGQAVVRLSVRRSNKSAIDLYHREGYKLVDIWNQYYFDQEDALVLEKKR